MLKHFLLLTVFSAAALVGCATNETKPETTLKPSAKAVVPPVTAKTTPPLHKKHQAISRGWISSERHRKILTPY
jgi:ABC-type uncharacterized transport system auxiliary subunit